MSLPFRHCQPTPTDGRGNLLTYRAPAMSLRILQVISSSARSGAERHTVDLCRQLAVKGHQVWAAIPEGSWLEQELKENGIVTLPCHFKKAGGLSSVLMLRRAIKQHQIQVVHSHLSRATLQSAAAARLAGIKAVATVHVKSVDPAFRLVVKHGGRLVAVSHFIKKVLVEGGFPQQPIRVVYNATDLGDEPLNGAGNIRSELGLDSADLLAGVVGRVANAKGQRLALEALADCSGKVPNLHLAFVGRCPDSDYEAELRRSASEKGLADRVHFLGERKDVVGVLDALDILMVPSQMESFGLAALEAMTRGKPVMAANVGGLPEVVDHQVSGLVLPLERPAWSQGLAELALDKDLMHRMGEAGRLNAKTKFSVEKMVQDLELIYSEAVR